VPELAIIDMPASAPIPDVTACARRTLIVAIDFARKITILIGKVITSEMKSQC
jgi:hypothetical protein